MRVFSNYDLILILARMQFNHSKIKNTILLQLIWSMESKKEDSKNSGEGDSNIDILKMV